MSIKKEFVPYELALELKRLGFDEYCFGWYYSECQDIINYDRTRNSCGWLNGSDCIAPTFSQAFRWFREKYNFLHHISWVYKKTGGIEWFFDIKGIDRLNNNILPHSETRFATYEEAELACLRKLIEIAKEKQ